MLNIFFKCFIPIELTAELGVNLKMELNTGFLSQGVVPDLIQFIHIIQD